MSAAGTSLLVRAEPVAGRGMARAVAWAAAAMLLGVALLGVGGAVDARILRAAAIGVIACASLVDLRSRRIPNALVVVALVLAVTGAPDRPAALVAGVAAAAPLLALAIARPGAMGMGDVKLALAAGMVAGLANVGALLLGTALIGAVFAIGVALVRGPRTAFAYGPAIAAALVLAIR